MYLEGLRALTIPFFHLPGFSLFTVKSLIERYDGDLGYHRLEDTNENKFVIAFKRAAYLNGKTYIGSGILFS